MKKVLLLAGVVLALMVCGCEDATAKVSNSNSAVVTVGGKKITKGQIYDVLKNQDESETILTMAVEYIAEKEIETTDEITAEAKKALAEGIESFGENFEAYCEYMKYNGEEDYYNKDILPEVKKNHLAAKYCEENFAAVTEYYYPTKVRMIEAATTEDANKALSEIKAGADFAEVAKKYSTSAATLYDGAEHMISREDQESLADLVLTFIRNNDTPTLSNVLEGDNLDKFYIVQITACNPEQYKDEAIALISGIEDIETEYTAYYLKKYNFKVYDVDFNNYLKENYPTYLK